MIESKTFCYTAPRNYRYLFLVDDQVSKSFICNLIMTNYRYWGGRYNPIILVRHNTIDQSYIDIIQYLDPDYVYYSAAIDVNAIKANSFLHPKEFLEIDGKIGNNIEGVSANNFLTEDFKHDYSFTRNLKLIHLDHNLDFPTRRFYELSFGMTPLYMGEDKYMRGFQHIEINSTNVKDINKFLHEEKPYFKCLLSELHANTTTVRPKDEWAVKQLEFIIYDDENAIEDLLYFWNRQLYQQPNNRLKQLIASKSEFQLLIQDLSFEGFLYEMLYGESVYLVSKSLDVGELNTLRGLIQAQFKHVSFQINRLTIFPFEHFQTIHIGGIHKTKNLLQGSKDYLRLPLPVVNDSAINSGHYIYDIELVTEAESHKNIIKFPYFTDFYHILCQQEGRINAELNVSLFVSDAYPGIDIKIPTALEIIRIRLQIRHEFTQRIQMPVSYPILSNAGQKLSAFINLFDQDWDCIEGFVGDKFWLQLFMGNSDFHDQLTIQISETAPSLSTKTNEAMAPETQPDAEKKQKALVFEKSNIPGSKGIFSYKDLQHERNLIYFFHRDDIRNLFKRESADFVVEEDYLNDFITRQIDDDFDMHIDRDMQYLVNRDGLFMGMKVKCNQCGSNIWYSLNELQNKMSCKGCLNQVIPKFKSPIYYRLNEVIVNNLAEVSHNRKKPYYGNYVVLKTLATLKKDSRHSNGSFLYAPCLEFEITEKGQDSWTTDIDILAIQDGRLIIGEAKSSGKEFNTKVITQLIWFANNIKPDKLILAYESDEIDQTKLDRLSKAITYKSCEIVVHKVGHPWYRFGRVFGLPHEKEEKK